MTEKSSSREALLDAYRSAPDELETALSGLSGADLDRSREEDAWTIREIVHHIVDSDSVVTTLMMAALGNPGCTYDQSCYPVDNSWSERLEYAERPVEPALRLFRANHESVGWLLGSINDARGAKRLFPLGKGS